MSLEKLRSLPEFQNASDAEILGALSKTAGVPLADVASAFGADTGGKWGNRLSASIDNYQANLYGVGEALTGSETLRNRRVANEAEAELSRSLAQRQGAIMSYKDVGGVGDALDYVGGLAVDSLPYLGEAVVGGLTGGSSVVAGNLARAGISRGAARTLGGVAASYPSAVGDILQNQREETGTTNVGAALVGGVPYAGLNALGIEGALARGTLTRSGIRALDEMTGLTGVGLRTGASMLKNAAVEGPSEVGQEMINQSFGRMAVNPDQTLFNPEANDRYMESLVGGAALGGVFGGAAGGWRRSEGYLPPGQNVDNPEKPADLLGTGLLPPTPGAQGDLFGDLGAEGLASTLPAYGETTELDKLRSDLGELTAMADQAYRTGDRNQLELLNEAIQQTQQQIRVLEPADTSRAPLLPSGVQEMISGQPVELFNYELDNNLMPFVGDTNIDFPMQQGDLFQYTGGIEPTGLYTALGEQPAVPGGELVPSSQRLTTTDIPVVGTNPSVMPVDMFGNVAATPVDAANQADPGAVIARQQWAKQQESIKAAQAVKQQIEANRAAAGKYGIKGDTGVDLFVNLQELLQGGEIDQPRFNELAGMVAARQYGKVRGEIRNVGATQEVTKAVAANNAQAGQTPITKVSAPANAQAPVTRGASAATAANVADPFTEVEVRSVSSEQTVVADAKKAVADGKGVPVSLKNGAAVRMVALRDTGNTEGVVVAIDEAGNEVGYLSYAKVESINPLVEVAPEWRRLGLATQLYDIAESLGGKIPPADAAGQIRSRDAVAFRDARASRRTQTVASVNATTDVQAPAAQRPATATAAGGVPGARGAASMEAPRVDPNDPKVKKAQQQVDMLRQLVACLSK